MTMLNLFKNGWMIILLLTVSACTLQPTTPGTQVSEIKHFTSEQEFATFMQTYRDTGYAYRGGVMLAMDAAVPMMAAGEKSEGAVSNDYSGTNVQVQGIDEGDIIKTDGAYIYTLSGNTLHIISAGEDASIVSELVLTDRPEGLFIDGNYLIIYGNYYHDFNGFRPSQGLTFVTIYDVTSKEDPSLLHELKFEGNYFESRMLQGSVFITTFSYPTFRADPRPILFEGTTQRAMPVDNIYYFDRNYDSPVFIQVHKIAPNTGDVTSAAIAVESQNTLYMSDENIYITSVERVNEWEIMQDVMIDVMQDYLTVEDKQLITRIELTDDDILSPAEKQGKIYSIVLSYQQYLSEDELQQIQEDVAQKTQDILSQYEYREYTSITKMRASDLAVIATGKVPGYVNNQFSLDEFDGVLRVATTISQQWSMFPAMRPEVDDAAEKIMPPRPQQESENMVFTLDADLNVMDSITNIAEGEQIYSTRFAGEKLYLVTFRQVDPFFVVDLSDPSDIALLGELKVPGFSRYLHPYDEHTIIGIGRDATEEGRQLGLKISIFDVSDVEHPRELASFVTEEQYAYSTAEYEHKAFLFSKEKELLVIPAYSYAAREGDAEQSYNGAMVFRITRDDIVLRGIIDHGKGQQYWSSLVERSLYIDNLLYTKSQGLLRVNDLADLSSVQRIELGGGDIIYDGVYEG